MTTFSQDKPAVVTVEAIASRILVLHDQRALLDTDLAVLYGASTRRLNEHVKRKPARFPRGCRFPADRRRDQGAGPVAICDRFPEAAGSALFAVRLHRGARTATLSTATGHDVLVSPEAREALGARWPSLGSFELPGVGRPIEVYALPVAA